MINFLWHLMACSVLHAFERARSSSSSLVCVRKAELPRLQATNKTDERWDSEMLVAFSFPLDGDACQKTRKTDTHTQKMLHRLCDCLQPELHSRHKERRKVCGGRESKRRDDEQFGNIKIMSKKLIFIIIREINSGAEAKKKLFTLVSSRCVFPLKISFPTPPIISVNIFIRGQHTRLESDIGGRRHADALWTLMENLWPTVFFRESEKVIFWSFSSSIKNIWKVSTRERWWAEKCSRLRQRHMMIQRDERKREILVVK